MIKNQKLVARARAKANEQTNSSERKFRAEDLRFSVQVLRVAIALPLPYLILSLLKHFNMFLSFRNICSNDIKILRVDPVSV
jgi:hypothetical protein